MVLLKDIKTRLVIMGNRQQYGVDYVETFALIVKLTTVRALLAMVALDDWEVFQFDVKNAFLHGGLAEHVFMKFPTGYQGFGLLISINYTSSPSKVCKLQKSLYGLKQAPRQWLSKLSYALQTCGLTQSQSDYSLFTKHHDHLHTIILIYVDDLLIAGNDNYTITQNKAFLSSQFHMKDLGHLRYFFGIKVNRSSQGIFLSHSKYTTDLLKDYKMHTSKPLKLPLDPNTKLSLNLSDPHPSISSYQQLIGQLIYIAFDVHMLSQFMHKPTTFHMQAAKRVFRYLKTNPHQEILLASSSKA